MLNKLIQERKLPPLSSREEMLEILQREEYGFLPDRPIKTEYIVEENIINNFCAGKAKLNKITIKSTLPRGEFAFPCYVALPTAAGKHPFFVLINFRADVPDRFMPTEELIDNGFAVLSYCYKDITSDNGDFTNGLAGVLYENGERTQTDAGKIAMWAWGVHRVMDYAETLSDILDLSRAAVAGHSRLGKTALLAAATDTRFKFAYSNNSGCSGAALSHGKKGESVENIYKTFPFWFCRNYGKYGGNEENMPFDQHYLLASIAPRYLLVGSASEDSWADPISEFLCCAAASPAFGKNGFSGGNRLPEVGERFFSGDIGYHLRCGLHYLGREDWQKFIEFVKSKK